jgi:hypothetical protein
MDYDKLPREYQKLVEENVRREEEGEIPEGWLTRGPLFPSCLMSLETTPEGADFWWAVQEARTVGELPPVPKDSPKSRGPYGYQGTIGIYMTFVRRYRWGINLPYGMSVDTVQRYSRKRDAKRGALRAAKRMGITITNLEDI